jgi:putative transposase
LGGEDALGWTAEIVRHPPKPAPEEVMMRWAREWAKEGVAMDVKKLLPPEGPRPFLPRRWVVERALLLVLSEQEAELMDYERLPKTGEALIYAAMSRLMARRLARK